MKYNELVFLNEYLKPSSLVITCLVQLNEIFVRQNTDCPQFMMQLCPRKLILS